MVRTITRALTRRRLFAWGGRAAASTVAAGSLLRSRPSLPDAERSSRSGFHPDDVYTTYAPRWAAAASADMPAPDPAVHLLSRAGYGATPADLARVRSMGTAAWIDWQLDYPAIDDRAVEGPLLAGLPVLGMDLPAMWKFDEHAYRIPDALNAATLYRQAFSPRQLYEAMVDFWTDHYSIYGYMENGQWHKTIDDREVIRRHALGKFKDLLTASAQSPAMLHYLNNDENAKGHPNENYAREIMELHTLGVAANGVPYTEDDVLAVARCFTGWTWVSRQGEAQLGSFVFKAALHDDGHKDVLGHFIPALGGVSDAFTVIDILCHHPATAKFLATKLVRRFVTDDPLTHVPGLVDRVAAAYTSTDGDIKAMVRVLLNSEEFAGSFNRYGGRLTRPLDLTVRMMRATGVPQSALPPKLGYKSGPFWDWYTGLVGWNGYLNQMGQVPFDWLTPDGYPEIKEAWTGAAVMLARWNMALGYAGGLVTGFEPHKQRPADLKSPEAIVDYWIDQLVHRPMLPEDRALVLDFYGDGGTPVPAYVAIPREAQTVALILASPYFQWK